MMERQAVLDIGPFLPEWGESRASYDILRRAQKGKLEESSGVAQPFTAAEERRTSRMCLWKASPASLRAEA